MNKKNKSYRSSSDSTEKLPFEMSRIAAFSFAATHPIQETLGYLNTTLCGLEPGKVEENRSEYGSNKVTREKKKTLPQRLAGAFINPFTAILFCLALVSSFTDMIFPHFSLFGCVPKDFDCLTVVIILTMVFYPERFVCTGKQKRQCG